MKRIIILLLTPLFLFLTACGNGTTIVEEPETATLDTLQMKALCNLTVLDCYYHNVAKVTEEDAEGFWVFKKDKHFWIEYSGKVELGIDMELVNIDIDPENQKIVITMPKATVQDCSIDPDSLKDNSFIVDKKSANPSAVDGVKAIGIAEEKMKKAAKDDTFMIEQATQRAKDMMQDYVDTFFEMTGEKYEIEWVDLDAEGKPIMGTTQKETTTVKK